MTELQPITNYKVTLHPVLLEKKNRPGEYYSMTDFIRTHKYISYVHLFRNENITLLWQQTPQIVEQFITKWNKAALEPLLINKHAMPIITHYWDKIPDIFRRHNCERLLWKLLLMNEVATDFIDLHWDYVTNNTNRFVTISDLVSSNRHVSLLDKHWDWTMTRLTAMMTEPYWIYLYWMPFLKWKQCVPLIKKHWYFFKLYLPNELPLLLCNPDAIEFINEMDDNTRDQLFKKDARIPSITPEILANQNILKLHAPLLHHIMNIITASETAWEHIIYRTHLFQYCQEHWNKINLLNPKIWNVLCNNKTQAAIQVIDDNWQMALDNNLITDDYLYKLFANPIAIALIDRRWNEIDALSPISHHIRDYTYKPWAALLNNANAFTLIKKHYEELKPFVVYGFISKIWSPIQYYQLRQPVQAHSTTQILSIYWRDIFNTVMSNNSTTFMGNIYKHGQIQYLIEVLAKYCNDIFEANYRSTFRDLVAQKHLTYIYALPNIIVDEYRAVAIKWFRDCVAAELMAHVWHPRNIARFPSLGVDPDA